MKVSFKGKEFEIVQGTTHPAYSLECFDETKDEGPFRDKYWDIKPGNVVVDVGASYGAYTLTALSQGATVLAYEPEPTVFKDLVANVAANDWLGRCECSAVGLWDKEDIVDMYSFAPHWPPGTITRDFVVRRLDDAVELDRLDWLKLDVEGAEVPALRGALKTIEKHKPKLIIEAHIFLDATIPDQIKALLPGYTWEEVPRDPCVMLVGSPCV